VLLVYDPLGDVSVNEVDGEVEDLGSESALLMDLDKELDEEGTHVPLELGLHLHQLDRGLGRSLATHKGRERGRWGKSAKGYNEGWREESQKDGKRSRTSILLM
jgi:hypothetical protein